MSIDELVELASWHFQLVDDTALAIANTREICHRLGNKLAERLLADDEEIAERIKALA